MINQTRPILVVGGGIGGMAAAILLRRMGVPVHLVELDPDWRVYGAGISITGPTYRALGRLGLLDDVQRFGFDSTKGIRIHTAAGVAVADVPTVAVAPGLPSGGGIMRPVLHRLMRERTQDAGVEVRLGVSVEALSDDGEAVAVGFTDGTQGSYQAVIGADGARSALRTRLFPDAPVPRYTGQYCWRVNVARDAAVDQPHFYMGGQVTAGLMPVSADAMYLWLLQPEAERVRLADAMLPRRLAGIMAPFGGVLGAIRDGLDERSEITVRPLEAMLLPRPWYRGRVLLIGDAAHPTTPHLASGAGIAVEDALVLAEELGGAGRVLDAFERFMERRFERARMVVERSVEIGALQQAHGSPEQLKALMSTAEAALREDI